MGRIKKPPAVKLFIGLIFKEEAVFSNAKKILQRRFGQIDYESQILAFTHTTYYNLEFGKDLKRKFVSFEKLIPPCYLARIKNITNGIEKKLSADSRRLINIDPGYLDLGKIVLASTKDYKHRLYLNHGVYAEVTLFYQDKAFKPWEWTYPDYKTPQYIEIFKSIREIYAKQIP